MGDKMADELTPDEEYEIVRHIRRIQDKVAIRCGLSCGWVARQRQRSSITNEYEWVGWGAIVGKGYFFIPNEDARHDPEDAAFIDRLAEEVMGYPPDSPQHLQVRLDEARGTLSVLNEDAARLSGRIMDYIQRIAVLERKLQEAEGGVSDGRKSG